MRTIYALLVGINDYPIPEHRLFGCHNDVLAVKTYLESRVNRSQFNLNIKMLLSQEATRSNIARGFDQFLVQAGEGDVALFYFSGHGSQEPAGSFFAHLEPDGMNETLVCWDSRLQDGMDLADKELSTLIRLVSQRNPHIVTLLDCCHSGTGTRSAAEAGGIGGDYMVRKVETYDKKRRKDSYILPRDIATAATSRGTMATKGKQALMIPTGRHVALAAAESFQLAKETTLGGNRRGVFSYSLMEMLQSSAGNFTYDDLMRRVRTLVGQRATEQTPILYTPNPEDADRIFLDGTLRSKGEFFNLNFDRDLGWVMDGGAVHGLRRREMNSQGSVLLVFPGYTTAEQLHNPGMALGYVEVTDTTASVGKVRPLGSTLLDRNATFKARVFSQPSMPSRVFFYGDPAGVSYLRGQLARNVGTASFVREVGRLEEANYKLLALRNLYIISRAADGMGDPNIIRRDGIDYLPLVEQVPGYSPGAAQKALDMMAHITRWERSLELRNPSSSIQPGAVRMVLYHPDREEPIVPAQGGYRFVYRHDAGPQARPAFRLRLFNTSQQRLFCSILYMSSLYSADPNLLPEGGIWLDPGQNSWALGGEVIEAAVPDSFAGFNRFVVSEVFKLFVSTARFNASILTMPPLGEPRVQFRSVEALNSVELALSQSQDRTLSPRDRSAGVYEDWNATELSLVIQRQ